MFVQHITTKLLGKVRHIWRAVSVTTNICFVCMFMAITCYRWPTVVKMLVCRFSRCGCLVGQWNFVKRPAFTTFFSLSKR